jgi:putative transposase
LGDRAEDVWTDIRGQALLGEDGFVEKLSDYLKKHKDVPEIPRGQRYAHRPLLKKIFNEGERKNLQKRRRAIVKAVEQYGYRRSEIADHLGIRYSTVSRIV